MERVDVPFQLSNHHIQRIDKKDLKMLSGQYKKYVYNLSFSSLIDFIVDMNSKFLKNGGVVVVVVLQCCLSYYFNHMVKMQYHVQASITIGLYTKKTIHHSQK